MRDFRFSRMEKVMPLNETFGEKRTGKAQVQPIIVIRIRFAPKVVRWVREQQHYAYEGDEREASQGTVMAYYVNDVSEIVPWILGWGASAEVLSPKELRKSLRETAQKLANLLT
jgi:predicted DNA-binding transcriptional regulator YafY